MHIELSRRRLIQKLLARPRLGPLVARLSSERMLRRNLRKIVADPASLGDDELSVMWQLLIADGGRAVLPVISRYQEERVRFWYRWIGALRETDLPTSIVWARADPVAVEEMAHVLCGEIRNSRLTLLDGLGHFPMIEAPETWASAVLESVAELLPVLP